MTRASKTLLPALCAAVLGACHGGGAAESMTGTWALRMTLDRPFPGREAAKGTTVVGVLVIPDPTPVRPRALPRSKPVDVRMDLRPFGVRVSPTRQPSVASLGMDSVLIDLGSTPRTLVLVGRMRGDSVAGRWWDDFRSGGESGRFLMTRAP